MLVDTEQFTYFVAYMLDRLDVSSPAWDDNHRSSMGADSVRGGIAGAACAKERDDARARAILINSQQVLQQPRLHAHLASDRSGRNTEVPFQDG